MRGAASLLLESGDRLDPERHHHMLRIIDESAASMSRLVEDVLLVCHLDAGDLRFQLSPVPARRVVESALAELGRAAGGERVDTRLADPDPTLRADPERAVTVLRALIDNALRVSPEGSAVELEVLPRDEQVRFEVRDRGPGLPAQQVEAAFQRFSRLDNAGGPGLGLYLARELARRMEGEVGVEARPGGGSSFWFRLGRDG